jgi:hypothetical protein
MVNAGEDRKQNNSRRRRENPVLWVGSLSEFADSFKSFSSTPQSDTMCDKPLRNLFINSHNVLILKLVSPKVQDRDEYMEQHVHEVKSHRFQSMYGVVPSKCEHT